VAKQEALIALLQEKRRALISHAVTKGLDPAATMRDSGVPWLGAVPAHWEVVASRRLITDIEQGWSPQAEDRNAESDEWAVIKLSAISKGNFRPQEHKTLPSDIEPDKRYEVLSGDLLLTRANTPELVGDICVVEDTRDKLMLCDLVYRVDVDKYIAYKPFIAYWFLSHPGRQQIVADARGASQSMVKISQGHIRSWLVVLPPYDEQLEITQYLRIEISKIDTLIAKTQQCVALLRERRTALIAAAVTGQIDVRGLPSPHTARIPE
jgi:type I restriction enzyme S subunit